MSTSIGGTLTGEGADFLIVDDPLTPMQALSNKFRQRALSWFRQSFMSRLNDKKHGAIVLIMQRLHNDDLSGLLLRSGGWEHLSLPAICTKNTKINFGCVKFTRKKGELLHLDREGIRDIENAKKELGSYAFASQYQQNPEQIENGIINPKWLIKYKNPPQFEKIYQSWDCAIKCDDRSDYTVCATFGLYGDKIYLIDILRKKLIYSKLKTLIVELANKYQPSSILIEDKASGQQLLQDLRHELPVVKCLPKWDKQTRLIISSYNIELGNFLIPYKANWLCEFEEELTNFPYVAHDDQVDALTQFFIWHKNQKDVCYKMYNLQDL
ncbi:Terminase-like family protein [Candidatus Cyrtobacter comes]|uniref:Terminase-like family protein n=1 Tax=Candidatus Cyrtobacter comes TaxID=675776 RepID=A0ABU5L929_9RICK|nr:phage terminase large subunit [Candidatus Cyrtobacter comes]MDZ5762633.1 Terminase-like family protein [Candidatus Cyrtobacter comes]